MVEKISNYIIDNVLYKDENLEGESREVMLFGITRIVEDVPKYTAIIIISLLLNVLDLVGIAFLITLAYKTFVGGAHARSNIECFIFSTLYFIVPALISKFITINITLLNIMYVINIFLSMYVILKIVPADTEEVPILNKEKRKQKKILSVISLVIIYCISYFFVQNKAISFLIIFMLILINLMCTKTVYKLLRCKYSHESEEYKKYFKK